MKDGTKALLLHHLRSQEQASQSAIIEGFVPADFVARMLILVNVSDGQFTPVDST